MRPGQGTLCREWNRVSKVVTSIDRFLMTAALAAIALLAITGTSRAVSSNPCPRFAVGSNIVEPEDLFSQNGTLTVNFSYQTFVDADGLTRFCYMLVDGTQSPTLHLNPGDTLVLNITNDTPVPTFASAMKMQMSVPLDAQCGAATMDASSTNVHFHGTNTSPTCGQDEVIHTLINSGDSFTYNVQFPADEPPGLYWYHPHVHGLSEAAVQGGASGAIMIEGIEAIQPRVAELPQQILLVRDNPVPGDPQGDKVPAWDVSLNYVPIPYPDYPPAMIAMKPREKQFWRVVNAAAGTILDLELKYDGVPQLLKVVGLDGVPTGSQDGTRHGKIVDRHHLLVPPAGRVEFMVTGPGKNIRKAILSTRKVNTGQEGDNDPARPLAQIVKSNSVSSSALVHTAASTSAVHAQRFEGLATAQVTAKRKLYFSEDSGGPGGDERFFITVDGATPVVFDPNNPPAITTTQGSVEDWVVQNRSLEAHEFHIHQIHFMLLRRNGSIVRSKDRQLLDMVHIPGWKENGPFPSVTVRMDFRGPDIGDFVYHCHILEHEDGGMMAIIRVIPGSGAERPQATPALKPVSSKANEGQLQNEAL